MNGYKRKKCVLYAKKKFQKKKKCKKWFNNKFKWKSKNKIWKIAKIWKKMKKMSNMDSSNICMKKIRKKIKTKNNNNTMILINLILMTMGIMKNIMIKIRMIQVTNQIIIFDRKIYILIKKIIKDY